MTKEETIKVLQSIEDRAVDFPYMTACDWVAIAAAKRHLSDDKIEEVDLEDEFDEYLEKQNAFTVNDNGEIKCYNGDSFSHVYDIYPIAKYFFELGLKTQKGE